ncbi:ABC transporter G family member 2 [Forsythia ovata]|uniref:ABC transporter G family member 2 n=1 Tax=Forsythia ovata TaxID=205694 RepID=A0ABD1UX64_9LAMI
MLFQGQNAATAADPVTGETIFTRTKVLLNDTSDEAHNGEIMAVMGAFGLGKSTMIDALANCMAKESLQGTVSLNGEQLESGYKLTSQRFSEDEHIHQDLESLSVSKRLVRSVSQKLKRKNNRNEGDEEDETRGVSLRCLTLYGRCGGCKVVADTCEEYGDPGSRRRSSASEDRK